MMSETYCGLNECIHSSSLMPSFGFNSSFESGFSIRLRIRSEIITILDLSGSLPLKQAQLVLN